MGVIFYKIVEFILMHCINPTLQLYSLPGVICLILLGIN